MKRLAMLLAAVLLPAALDAQDPRPAPGMVLDEGTWRAPTPATALRVLVNREGRDPMDPAVAVLRQTFEPRSDAELQAFVDELTRIMLEGERERRTQALVVLLRAGQSGEHSDPGTPYGGVTDILIRLYESYDDPVGPDARMALYNLFEVGGVDYILGLFESSEPPPPCQPVGGRDRSVDTPTVDNPCPNALNTWCEAGQLLLYGDEAGPREGAPNREMFTRLCAWGRTVHF